MEQRSNSPLLYLVIPCYHEEEALPITAKTLIHKLEELQASGAISKRSKILLVDDGSKDSTWEVIEGLCQNTHSCEGVKLTRNCGHQLALLAGLMTAKGRCDVSISMDADLQDDIHAIDHMLAKYQEGAEIVYGVRNNRKSDTTFKRNTAQGYYGIMRKLGVNLVYNHADYRLMSRKALELLAEYSEVNLFLRGIVPMLGLPTATVEYARFPRRQGESKYPLKKMLAFAFEGLTSLSITPIRGITLLGCVTFFMSLLMLIYVLVRYFLGYTVTGWASMAVSIWAIGGLQLLGIGIVGEYIGKIYLESKHRPRYHIEVYRKGEGEQND